MEELEIKRGRGRPKKELSDNINNEATEFIPVTEYKPRAQLREQTESDIFALDIGTRTVVGILGYMDDDVFNVVSSVTVAHSQRSMIDGQIEDIREVARIAEIVKSELEQKCGIRLDKVAVAAAGRALKTRHASKEFKIEEKNAIKEEQVRAFEVETVLEAQSELDIDGKEDSSSFYCVGHTVISYALDDYKLKSIAGHRGKKVSVELVAAFLPNAVVESLYSVMELCGFEVVNMTLEPIAAMNVIIPPDVRLINIALVDIGAGTSDIAISKNGSIIAYSMSTLAGDEVTEEIIKSCLVDFQMAESMKQSGKKEYLEYTDIFGQTHLMKTEDFFKTLSRVLASLADNIAENIIKINGEEAPAAVFLVGGGSLVPGLAKVLAEKLGLPESRVVVGGKSVAKHVNFGNSHTDSPEYVTPVGIALTSAMDKGYDFSTISLNGKKVRVFNTRIATLIDLLASAGYNSSQIIGRSGRNLTFTLNGEKHTLKGELAVPAEITLNGNPVSINTAVKQGDSVEFTPAVSGENASVRISDLAGDSAAKRVTVDGVTYNAGIFAKVGEKIMPDDYEVRNFDVITLSEIETLGDLTLVLPFTAKAFYINGEPIGLDYCIKDGDCIVTDNAAVTDTAENFAQGSDAEASQEKTAEHAENSGDDGKFHVILNNKKEYLKDNEQGEGHEFIELLSIADIDLDAPPPSGMMIMLLNGENAGFSSSVKSGDSAVIKWADL